MSEFKVTIEQVKVFPHPNADRLELAQVGLYRSVIAKGQFEDGDYALYIPEQAVLPPELIEELGLTGKLAGSEKNRVKAVRLRGELSQGIVCRPKAANLVWDCACETGVGEGCQGCAAYAGDCLTDFADQLGITKWVPQVPESMAGEVEAAPNLLRWADIENIKRYPDMFAPGEEVVATEKVHGVCFLLTYDVAEGAVWMSSKGMGGKNLAFKESDTNLYWRAAKKCKLPLLAAALADRFDAERIGLYGEVYGNGVQDLHYGADASQDGTLGFALFDVAIQPAHGAQEFLDANLWDGAVERAANQAALTRVPLAPVLYRGPYDYELLAKMAEGKETVSGQELHLREGLVVRPAYEARSELTGGRKIAKFVSEAYILRGGPATEYE